MMSKIILTNNNGKINAELIGNLWSGEDLQKAATEMVRVNSTHKFQVGQDVIIKYPEHAFICLRRFFEENRIESDALYYPWKMEPKRGTSGYIYGIYPFGDEPEVYMIRDIEGRIWLTHPDALVDSKDKNEEGSSNYDFY